jgi:glyoxylase-like metal-dependent hydrolase (beta-lactamase superfamily II)
VVVDKIHVIEHKLVGIFPIVNSFIAEGEDLVLVDTGLNAGSAKTIIRSLEGLGHQLSDVDVCIITHAHSDHTGGLKTLKISGEPFLVAAHDSEADAVEKATGVEVDLRLIDGQTLGGFTVLYLPGHTFGSIGLLGGGALITGDAINERGGELKPPNPMFTKNRAAALDSVRSLTSYDFDKVLVSHGKPVEKGGKEALTKLIERIGEPNLI